MRDALTTCVEKIYAAAVHAESIHQSEEEFKTALRMILAEYYKAHSIEILCHIEEQGVFLDGDNIKIGGTD